ncbi:type II toxin-antitoxin system VapC family toxin [Hydrogenispora ethanolica]|uniref:type II toxin-antitoxin system VapC family toxin n=1 Tax=Hydrogenispora ethanolica TaxID=1082276 RepID=UPI00243726DB|nr:PIN domain-containing protein [Hydrogenispora ethanolica]
MDTNCFIYHIEQNPRYIGGTRELFNAVEHGRNFGITSVLVLTEVLTHTFRQGNEVLAGKYRLLLKRFPNLTLVEVGDRVAELSAKIRAEYGLKVPDAIFVATGILNQADFFVTNDKQLKIVNKPKVLILEDILIGSGQS